MRPWRRLLHRLAHLFRTADGRVETWYEARPDGTERLMVGYRCDRCGRLYHVNEVDTGWDRRGGTS